MNIETEPYKKASKATFFIFAGIVTGILISFLNWVMIIRYLTPEDFGFYSLVITIVTLASSISYLGLSEGVTRYISFYRGKNNPSHIWGCISSSIRISLVLGLFLLFSLILLSKPIAKFYNIKELATGINIYAFSIPFAAVFTILFSIFRGFELTLPKVLFNDFLRNIFFLSAVIFVIFFNLKVVGIIYAALISIVIAFLIFAAYSKIKIPKLIKPDSKVKVGKDLIIFSLPLWIFVIISTLVNITDTLMLSYFCDMEKVGLYNGALRLSKYLPIFLTSVNFIYLPITTNFFSQGQKHQVKDIYAFTTKWIVLLSFPIFLLFFLSGKQVLILILGENYASSYYVLRLLSLGMFFTLFVGPNGSTLLALGETRPLILYSILVFVFNIVLNYIFIPMWGIIGAAFTTMLSFTLISFLISLKLYKLSSIHPFSLNYLLFVIVSFLGGIIFYNFLPHNIPVIWQIILSFSGFFFISFIAFILSGTFNKKDRILLNQAKIT
jgi:O-antigen/teichoic acid export membrane protein